MIARISYSAAWVISAAALLSIGFLAWTGLAARLAIGHAGAADAMLRAQAAFAVYARVVLLKGLLPALLISLALWPLLDRGGRFSRRGRFGLALGLGLAATLGSVAIAASLMPLAMHGLPPVAFTGTGNFVRTCAEMAAAITLAAWIPRILLPKSPRYAALVLAGIGVVVLAGGASMTRWAQLRAAEPAQPAAEAATPPDRIPAAPPAVALADAAPPLAPSKAAPLPTEVLDAAAASKAEPLDPEEIARRRATAARLRELIEAGPDATGPAIVGGLLAEGEPQPVYESGELLGVELQHLRPDGFYARLGLRDGDLVQSINGVALDASGELLAEIVRSPQLELLVERDDGTRERIAVRREQWLEGLKHLE